MTFEDAEPILARFESMESVLDMVQAIRDLRAAREKFDGAMMMAIYLVEQNHMGLLRDNACDSIERFIRSYDLCCAARYKSYVIGLEKVGQREAFEMGADAVIQVGKAESEDAVSEYVASVAAWSSERDGVAPSRLTAEKIFRQVQPQKTVPAPLKRQSENALLKKRVHELEVENKMLRREVSKLEKELAKREKKAA